MQRVRQLAYSQGESRAAAAVVSVPVTRCARDLRKQRASVHDSLRFGVALDFFIGESRTALFSRGARRSVVVVFEMSCQRGHLVASLPLAEGKLSGVRQTGARVGSSITSPSGARRSMPHMRATQRQETRMWSWADRMVKAVSNATVGTVIVLVHVALADRKRPPYDGAVSPRRISN